MGLFKGDKLKKLGVTMLLILPILLTGCGKKKKVEKPKEIFKTVRVKTIEKTEFETTARSSGIVDPINEVTQVSETGGDVAKINYKNGEFVKKGATIVKLTDREVESNYNSAYANNLSSSSDFETKKINFQKYKKLYEEDLISEDEYLSVKNQYTQSISSNQMTKATLSSTQKDYADLTMRAKISGIVTDLDLNEYEKIEPDTKVFTIIDDSIMRIKTSVSPSDINSLKEGVEATISPEGTDEIYTGTVYEINPVADSSTKKFPIKVQIDNKDRKLKKGVYASVTIKTGTKKGYVVPLASIVVKDLYSYIFIDDNGVARQIKVRRGYTVGDQVEIISDELPETFQVVTDGQFLLENRDKLKVVE